MRVAIPYENGRVFQHFGHTKQFKLYQVEAGAAAPLSLVDASGGGHGALAGLLQGLGAEALICGGIGPGAKSALAQAGIQVYPGVAGSADQAAADLAAGRLVFHPEAGCSGHHENSPGCGAHPQGAHSCGAGEQEERQ